MRQVEVQGQVGVKEAKDCQSRQLCCGSIQVQALIYSWKKKDKRELIIKNMNKVLVGGKKTGINVWKKKRD